MNDHPATLASALSARLGQAGVQWLSPLREDAYAEYSDGDFLDLLGAGELRPALRNFWPSGGPNWDALGRTHRGDLLLVEAKAHVAEMFSPETRASAGSRTQIEAALARTAVALGARPRAPWTKAFYQYANRLAHLYFLREQGRAAWLVLVSYLDDDEMDGPATAETWNAAYAVMHHVMGLRTDHPLSRYVIHLHPRVGDLTAP